MLNRTLSPMLSPLSAPTLLSHKRITLDNGVEIVYINDPSQEVFKMDVVFEAGVYYQPQALVASTAINMLNEGTRQHSAEAIADLFDYYGAYTDFNCGLNKSELSLISLNKYAAETIGIFAELITDSTIPEKELEIFLTNKRQEFLVSNEQTSYLARKKFSELLFGASHPYANQVSEKDYTHISSALVRDFYHRYINARNCRIMICGNVSDEIVELTIRHFSCLSAPGGSDQLVSQAFTPAPTGRYRVQKDHSVQSSLRIGKEGVRLTDDDYAGFMLLNTILGGYFGSRLMSNIREEKGYTYGISSFNVSMPQGSYWCVAADVNKEYTEETIEETMKEIHRLQREKVGEDELSLVKNFLYGDLLRELDGVFSQSDALKHKLNYGLDNQIYIQLIEQIKKCSSSTLLELANQYWDTETMYVVTAGEVV
ncbi:MAG: pitrilysin family protein [Odoribacter sp.]